MKNYLFLLLLAFVFSSSVNKQMVYKVSFTPKSSLIIKGKSNVNKFDCAYDTYQLRDSLIVSYKKIDNKVVFEKAFLNLTNSYFNCNKRGITRDFHKLLKTEEFPNIKMSLLNVDLTKKAGDSVYTKMAFSICNKTNEYLIPILVLKSKNTLKFKGSISINIEDYDLEAPKKVLGIIKVDNMIVIDFSLDAVLL